MEEAKYFYFIYIYIIYIFILLNIILFNQEIDEYYEFPTGRQNIWNFFFLGLT